MASRLIFDKYYKKTDDTPVYAAAIILHPSRRTQYIRQNWKKDRQKRALSSVKKLWEEYQHADIADLAAVASYTSRKMESLSRELDEFDLMAKDLDVISGSSEEDEYEMYISQNPIQISGSALDWWLHDEQQQRWPRLSQMAIDLLSIPAMSDEPERVFSGARRTISWDRMQLGRENIEKIECLKSWMRNNIAVGPNEALDEAVADEGLD
jgi:hypothetical protein